MGYRNKLIVGIQNRADTGNIDNQQTKWRFHRDISPIWGDGGASIGTEVRQSDIRVGLKTGYSSKMAYQNMDIYDLKQWIVRYRPYFPTKLHEFCCTAMTHRHSTTEMVQHRSTRMSMVQKAMVVYLRPTKTVTGAPENYKVGI